MLSLHINDINADKLLNETGYLSFICLLHTHNAGWHIPIFPSVAAVYGLQRTQRIVI